MDTVKQMKKGHMKKQNEVRDIHGSLRLQGVKLANTYTDTYTHASGESSIPYYSRKQDKIKAPCKNRVRMPGAGSDSGFQ